MITLIYVQACFLGLSPWRPWLQRALALESCHWPETPVTSGLNSCQHFSLYSHIFDWGSQCVASSWVEWNNLMLMQFSNDWGGLSWRWAMYINVCVYIYIFIAMFVQIWTILSTNFPCMQVNPSRDQWRFLGDGMVDWVSRRGLGLGLGTVLSPKVEFPNLPNPLAFQCFWTWSKKSHNLRWRKACAIAGWESKEGWAQRGPFLSSGPVTTK